ncbi:Peptidyl-prolyl cis-trans isomerase FKBP16-1, chloroplastic [Gracilariopsis chorda]|uniref:peptidylprolyl isomerase n=1 Tax=Gracilariopsis chorda TaxID=448386 RepID=A0A2V3J0W7_9FLOR|nr:Peptidyl-prolyl cis-trans isomerase FKBP16-1, chloroplastic [Gracilariopsis chorda]|eukprot:PXF47943.1 Peptidyl-prolyl cis-trans isomerase FKBP16-1, chloroplastic [Gracilariopsis chorda]
MACFAVLPLLRSAEAALDYPELRGLAEQNDRMPVFKMENAVRMQELTEGNGETKVQDGSLVSLKYVLRRSNGYFIDASYGFDRFDTFTFRVGSGQVVEGFEAGVRGMREGGRRRFIVPPEMGYVKGTRGAGPIPPDFGAKRSLGSHAKEPLIFEVEVVKVR